MTISQRLKRIFKRNEWLRTGVRRFRYWNLVRKLRGPKILRRFARLHPNAYFIQIGANDGEQLDPLRSALMSYNWRGLMVEPVPFVFEKLKSNSQVLKGRVELENVAIADIEGQLPFWHLRQAEEGEALPRLYDALGSFRKEVILKHRNLIPDIEERLMCSEVPCLTFEGLCRKHGVERIDLIQIDTEGYDFEIIQSIDFDRYRPVILIYEHHHFDEEARQACQRYLGEYGYEFFEEGLDTWCFYAGTNSKKLTRYWRKLVPVQTE